MKHIIYAIIGTICFFIGVIGLEILIYKKQTMGRKPRLRDCFLFSIFIIIAFCFIRLLI